MNEIHYLLRYTLAGITFGQIALAIGCILGGFVLRWISMIVLRWLLKLTARTETTLDDIIIGAARGPLGVLCVILGLWMGVELLPIPTKPYNIYRFLSASLRAATEIIVIWFLIRLNDRAANRAYEKAVASGSHVADFVPLGRKTAKIFLIIVAVLLVVQQLGYSVTSLIAGLGLGGLAIGLAAKDTIANFFGSVVIFVDRPFQKGDWIKVGDNEGVVEEIGVRVTRIRTFSDSLITMPNSLLTTTAIQNFARMRRRRIRMTLQVTYDTSREQLETAINRIRDLIARDERFVEEGLTVTFLEFGTYSLNILVNCYAATTSYSEYTALQQELMLNIMRIMEELKIEFAFPTQTVIHESGERPPSS